MTHQISCFIRAQWFTNYTVHELREPKLYSCLDRTLHWRSDHLVLLASQCSCEQLFWAIQPNMKRRMSDIKSRLAMTAVFNEGFASNIYVSSCERCWLSCHILMQDTLNDTGLMLLVTETENQSSRPNLFIVSSLRVLRLIDLKLHLFVRMDFRLRIVL